jgi:hypothetical protein
LDRAPPRDVVPTGHAAHASPPEIVVEKYVPAVQTRAEAPARDATDTIMARRRRAMVVTRGGVGGSASVSAGQTRSMRAHESRLSTAVVCARRAVCASRLPLAAQTHGREGGKRTG